MTVLLSPPEHASILADLNTRLERHSALWEARKISSDRYLRSLEKIRAAKAELHRQADEWRDLNSPGWRDALTVQD